MLTARGMVRFFALFAVVVAFAANAEVELPRGWRRPAAAQNEVCVEKGEDPYRIAADFDGDARADEARLLIKESGQTLGLWVWMADKEPLLLFHWPGVRDGHHQLGIALVPGPDSAETWCGKMDSCEPGQPSRVSWANASIGFYQCESSGELISWDSKRQRFRSVLISD